jgi:AcrR family transcriptional regulator
MPLSTSARPIRLTGEDLREHRHICALVEGPVEADALLIPFIVEGIEAGDRAIDIVDPGLQESHTARLGESGIDIGAAMASGQLEVRTWGEAYLRGGTFDPSAQLSYVRAALDEGSALGYSRTRLIGSTEWAVEVSTVRDLLAYEAKLDDILGNSSDLIVCTYDLRHHSARTIADVLGIHDAAVVGGEMRTGRGPARAPARDRLLAAASRFFHESGIQATGVDTLIAEAGIAKATFYRHFPSKDDLVVAWLKDPRTRWLDRVRRQVEAQGGDGAEAVPLFFEALADWLAAEGYRGCPYLNTAAEVTDASHPARTVVVEFLQDVEDYLADLVAAAGYRNPRPLAAQLQVLAAGAITLAVARRSGAAALAARDAAVAVLSKAERT